MSRITADADDLRGFFSSAGVYIASNVLTIAGILTVMLFWDYRLAMLYMLMLPLMIFGMYKYAVNVQPVFGQVRKKFAGLTEMIQEDFRGIEVTKLFGQEKRERQQFNEKSRELKIEISNCIL